MPPCGTYSLHHILNRSHYRPAPSSRRHHTHYSCIITQYTCLHRRQCVQSLQVPYQCFVLNLLVGEGNSEIFTFSFWLYLKIAGVLVGIFAANTLLRILAGHCYTRFHRCGFRPVLATLILFALFSNFYHAYAAVAQKTSVIRSAPCLPYYFPLTATRLMMKLGVVSSKDVIKMNFNNKKQSADLNYPIDSLKYEVHSNPKNVVLIAIDSWNYRALTRTLHLISATLPTVAADSPPI